MQFFKRSQSTPSRIRSVAGVVSAVAVLLSIPLALLGQVLGIDPGITVHLFLWIGMLFLAYAVFQFDLPRWLAWAGFISTTGLGVIFLLQGLTELTKNESCAASPMAHWDSGRRACWATSWWCGSSLHYS